MPNYYSIMPASVRYDKNLTFLEKFIYSEITALSNVDGYCYCGNDYFAKLYDKSDATISRALSKLDKSGYIHIEYKRVGSKVIDRKIYLTTTKSTDDKIVNGSEITVDKNVTREQQKLLFTVDKIVKENNVTYNTILSLIMYNVPKDIKEVITSFNFSKELEDSIYKWLQFKKEKKQGYKTTGLNTLLNQLSEDAKKNGEQYVIDAIEYSMAQNYNGIYPRKDNKPIQQNKKQEEVKNGESDWLMEMFG